MKREGVCGTLQSEFSTRLNDTKEKAARTMLHGTSLLY